jgi:hypothetical protein
MQRRPETEIAAESPILLAVRDSRPDINAVGEMGAVVRRVRETLTWLMNSADHIF